MRQKARKDALRAHREAVLAQRAPRGSHESRANGWGRSGRIVRKPPGQRSDQPKVPPRSPLAGLKHSAFDVWGFPVPRSLHQRRFVTMCSPDSEEAKRGVSGRGSNSGFAGQTTQSRPPSPIGAHSHSHKVLSRHTGGFLLPHRLCSHWAGISSPELPPVVSVYNSPGFRSGPISTVMMAESGGRNIPRRSPNQHPQGNPRRGLFPDHRPDVAHLRGEGRC